MYITTEKNMFEFKDVRTSFSLSEEELKKIIDKMMNKCDYPTAINSESVDLESFINDFDCIVNYDEPTILKGGDVVLVIERNSYKLVVVDN